MFKAIGPDLCVVEIGTKVMLDNDIPAIVTSINIRGAEHRVSYECTWWDGRCRKAEWFDGFEIIVESTQKARLPLRFV